MMKYHIFLAFLFVAKCGFGQTYSELIHQHREHYKEEFLKSKDSPLTKEKLDFLSFFEPDSSYRIACTFHANKRGKPFELPTSSGKTKTYVKFGELHFLLNGNKHKLSVYQSLSLRMIPQYRDYLFIPFKDLSNGTASYGGGRYLDLRMGEIQGDTIYLDFNKSYNPYCAYSEGYSCPIPPKENHLKVRIEAGEKNYASPH